MMLVAILFTSFVFLICLFLLPDSMQGETSSTIAQIRILRLWCTIAHIALLIIGVVWILRLLVNRTQGFEKLLTITLFCGTIIIWCYLFLSAAISFYLRYS